MFVAMTTLDTADVLRKTISRLGARGRGQRYPAELRERIISHAREQQRGGVPTTRVARSLGIPQCTLTLWLRAQADVPHDRDVFRAVVVAEPPPRPVRERIVVETRGGLRITGLEIEQVVEIVRSLG